MRVYVVDDQRAVRQLLLGCLKKEFEVQAFESAKLVLEAIHDSPPDVLLSDLVMPEMDGMELLRVLKSNPLTEQIPVIVLTAQQDVQLLQEALELGAHDYIVKPSEPVELVARLKAAGKLSYAQRELSRAYRMIKREVEEIGRLQNLLLPQERVQDRDGYCMVSYYQPCMDSGGDFFDVSRLNDGRVVFAIGDVSGHGARSTVIMAVLKALYTEYVNRVQKPSQLVKLLNQKLFELMPVPAFITFFLAFLDLETGELLYSSAGHEYPLWFNHEKGRVVPMKSREGYPLLVDANAKFSLHRVNLGPEDKVLFYTDGLYDILLDGERFGYDRFIASMEEVLAKPWAQCREGLDFHLQELIAQADRPDDITFFVMSYTGRRNGL